MNEMEQRIRRFELLGGVDLARLEPEARQPVLAKARIGTAHLARAQFAFRCQMCGNQVVLDSEMEPMCTGPSWTDDHPPIVMDSLGQIQKGRRP